MKTYDGNLIQRSTKLDVFLRSIAAGADQRDYWLVLVDDNGNPPSLGETVMIGGRTAEVTASNEQLVNDSGTGGRFIAAFKP